MHKLSYPKSWNCCLSRSQAVLPSVSLSTTRHCRRASLCTAAAHAEAPASSTAAAGAEASVSPSPAAGSSSSNGGRRLRGRPSQQAPNDVEAKQAGHDKAQQQGQPQLPEAQQQQQLPDAEQQQQQLPAGQQQQELPADQQQQQLPAEKQQQQGAQHPPIVLSPLALTGPTGSVVRNTTLGSWSAMPPVSMEPPPEPPSAAFNGAQSPMRQQQEQQRQDWPLHIQSEQQEEQHSQERQQQRQQQPQPAALPVQQRPQQQVQLLPLPPMPLPQQKQQQQQQQQQQQEPELSEQPAALQVQQRPQQQDQPLPLPPMPSSQQKQQRQQQEEPTSPEQPAALPVQQRPQQQDQPLPLPPMPSSQQQQQQQQQRQQREEHSQLHAALEKAAHNPKSAARMLTASLLKAGSIDDLQQMLEKLQGSPAYNIKHIATAYSKCSEMYTQQRKAQQQQQQKASKGTGAAQQGIEQLRQTLALLDQNAATMLSSWAAVQPASPAGVRPEVDVRSLSTIVNACARMQHKLPWEVVLLLLDAFLAAASEGQHTMPLPGQSTDLLYQQQQQPWQQILLERHSSQSGTASSSSSSSSSSRTVDGGNQAEQQQQQQQACHALSLLCGGLSKLGFTSSSAYESVDVSTHPDGQQRLQQQQQYWSRLAAVGAHMCASGSGRDLSTLCYAFAAGGVTDAALWGCLGPCAVTLLDSLTPQEFAQTLWAFGTARVAYQPLLMKAPAVAAQLAPGFTPQGIGNVLWALGSLGGGVINPIAVEAIQDVCLAKGMQRFSTVDLTMVVGAFRAYGSIRFELAVEINRAVVRSLPKFTSHNLCKVISALASVYSLQFLLMEAAATRLLPMIKHGKIDVQDACHGVWALAFTDAPAALPLVPDLLKLASKDVLLLVRSSDSTAKLCTILSLVKYRDDAFVAQLAHALITGQKADAALLYADAAAGNAAAAGAGASGLLGQPSRLQMAGTRPSSSRSSPMAFWDRPGTQQHIVSIAAMLAKLGLSQHTDLLQALAERCLALEGAHTNDSRHLSSSSSSSSAELKRQRKLMLLWCAAVLDMRQPQQLLQRLLQPLKGAEDMSTACMAQLVQVHMWLQTWGPAGEPLAALIPPALFQEAYNTWRSQLVPTVVFSQLHSHVLEQLTAMQLQPNCEAVTPDGLFSVDIMVVYKGCSVAIEVMGPDHYTANTMAASVPGGSDNQQQEQQQQHVLLGSELLRFRLLSARGFALAAVSAFEASGMATAAGTSALRKLLRQKLDEAVAIQQQYMAAQRRQGALTGSAPLVGAPDKQKRQRQQLQQQQRQQGAGPSQNGDPQLSRLTMQAGYNEEQQRVRRSKAKYLEQRQEQYETRGLAAKQGAMQTLLSAAGPASSDAPRAKGVRGDGFAGVSDADTSGFEDESAVVLVSFEDRIELTDSEFDLPLDLDGFDL